MAELPSLRRYSCSPLHLLVARSPHATLLKSYFATLEDSVEFLSEPGTGPQHLFTDGSCIRNSRPSLAAASWAVVNASTARPVAGGPLPGLTQTAARAELYAIVAAVHWAFFFDQPIHIWSDLQETVRFVTELLEQPQMHLDSSLGLCDLKTLLAELLLQCNTGLVHIHWIPSHLDFSLCTSEFEEWACLWNDAADRAAGICNRNRTPASWELWNGESQRFDLVTYQLRAHRNFFCAVSERLQAGLETPEPAAPPFADTHWGLVVGFTSLVEAAPINWGPLHALRTPAYRLLPNRLMLLTMLS